METKEFVFNVGVDGHLIEEGTQAKFDDLRKTWTPINFDSLANPGASAGRYRVLMQRGYPER